jgi:hypothetical protein
VYVACPKGAGLMAARNGAAPVAVVPVECDKHQPIVFSLILHLSCKLTCITIRGSLEPIGLSSCRSLLYSISLRSGKHHQRHQAFHSHFVYVKTLYQRSSSSSYF